MLAQQEVEDDEEQEDDEEKPKIEEVDNEEDKPKDKKTKKDQRTGGNEQGTQQDQAHLDAKLLRHHNEGIRCFLQELVQQLRGSSAAAFSELDLTVKEVLGDKAEKVLVVSNRITGLPCVLVTGQFGWSSNMFIEPLHFSHTTFNPLVCHRSIS